MLKAVEKLLTPNLTIFHSGKQAVRAGLAGSLCIGSAYLIPNFALEWTKSFRQAERKGTAVAPTEKLRTLFEKAKVELEYSPGEERVRIFTVPSVMCEVYGSVIPPGLGAIIGLPLFIHAESAEKISVQRKMRTALPKEEKESRLAAYKEASILTDTAKLYVIGEGLLLTKEPYNYLINCITASLCFLGTFLQLGAIVQYYSPRKIPSTFGVSCILMSASVWTAVALSVSDQLHLSLYKDIISFLSEKYIDGGIEYYEKLILRTQIDYEAFPHTFTDDLLDKNYMLSRLESRLLALKERKLTFVQSVKN